MRLQAYDDNGTMKFRQVSGSQALDSLPVGTTIGTIRTGGVIPNGYLEADGSTFDTAKYPELYSVLGSDTLPELFDHSSQIRYDLASTFVSSVWYTAPADGVILGNCEGPFTNDFRIRIRTPDGTGVTANQLMLFNNYNSNDWGSGSSLPISKGWQVYVDSESSMTQYFAPYDKHLLIKAATIGIADIDINTIKQELTYSTEETMTGKTWIDGKPIYRKTYYSSTNWANNTIVGTISNVSEVINIASVSRTNTKDVYQNYSDGSSRNDAVFNIDTGELLVRRAIVFVNSYPAHITIEYTKQ